MVKDLKQFRDKSKSTQNNSIIKFLINYTEWNYALHQRPSASSWPCTYVPQESKIKCRCLRRRQLLHRSRNNDSFTSILSSTGKETKVERTREIQIIGHVPVNRCSYISFGGCMERRTSLRVKELTLGVVVSVM